jgi:hypothetical protein
VISHRYRCIFIEVPKTGSTSVRALLGTPTKPHQNLWQIRYLMETEWTGGERLRDRLASSAYLWLSKDGRRRRGHRQFDEYFKFGFVRNPWDRLVSLYERREGLMLKDRMSFPDFVDWCRYSSSTCNHALPHRYQLDWFVDPHGKVLADFIGRFETLDRDWETVAARLGVESSLPHQNQNPGRKHYTEYYDARTRAIVADRFAVDIEYFGYEFDGIARDRMTAG